MKTTLQRWKQGMRELTPEQLLKAKATGHLYGTIGLIIGMAVLFYRGIWYFGLFLLAMIWLQWHEYRGAKQRYDELVQMMKDVEKAKQIGDL